VDRDALLVASLGAAVLTGCTTSPSPAPLPSGSPSPSPSVTPAADPDVALLVTWASRERVLAARYAALARSVPALAPLRANHTSRAAAVERLVAERGGRLLETKPPRALTGPRRDVVAAFVTAERRLAARYVAALRDVRDPDVAVLGAELAAGARQHAALLRLVP
jgi:hypothetical protein